MSNFRKLGKALVDFSRVRAVIPSLIEPKGIEVRYMNDTADFIPDDTPLETIAASYEAALRQDEQGEAMKQLDCGDMARLTQ